MCWEKFDRREEQEREELERESELQRIALANEAEQEPEAVEEREPELAAR